MSKSVMISIKPRWCELIASGEKTVEVRKTFPKLKTPFKCYIYCTRGVPFLNRHNGKLYLEVKDRLGGHGNGLYERLSGKVIGEFVCDEISEYRHFGFVCERPRYMRKSPGGYPATEIHFASLQLSPTELEEYGNGKPLCGWHISNLVIYDKPKKLGEFKRHDPTYDFSIYGEVSRTYSINRPPQNWCYVEEAHP